MALCINSNAFLKWIYLIVLHTHTYAGTEKRGSTPLHFSLSSWQSAAQFSVQVLLCCWCSAVWHWASRAELPTAAPPPRQCGKARRHAGLGSKCCQRRCRQSVPRLFVDCLFLFFSGNSRERERRAHQGEGGEVRVYVENEHRMSTHSVHLCLIMSLHSKLEAWIPPRKDWEVGCIASSELAQLGRGEP